MTRADLSKQPEQVAAMFDEVAPRYDLMNALMTGGQEAFWRRATVRAVAPRPGERVLDLAAGTATSSAALAGSGAHVVACDFSLGMLQQGRRRQADLVSARRLALVAGDALQLPFADAVFDAATVSFGLRNVADLDRALAELRRVVRPGGRLVVCETSAPPNPLLRRGHVAWLRTGLPRLARVFSSDPAAYEYLAESTLAWPRQEALARRMQAAGWTDVAWRDLTTGVVALHRARRPGGTDAPARARGASGSDLGAGATPPMDLRMRLFVKALAASRTFTVDGMTPAQMQRVRRELPHNPITDLVVGRLPRSVTTAHRRVPTRTGDVRVRVYRPRGTTVPLPLVLNYHGGGWALGNLTQADWLCGEVAARVPAVVVSVDYRLSPEHRYPAAVEDCEDALRWVVAHADELGGRADDVSVMGDSAGGNLAAVVALRARDHGGPPVRRQVLVYPAVDLTQESPSAGLLPYAPVLPKTVRDAFLAHYLGVPPDPEDTSQSPLRAASHEGLPATFVLTAEHDPLAPEGVAYAQALSRAGVPVRHTDYARMPHGFVAFPGVARAAPQAIAEITAFLRDEVPGVTSHGGSGGGPARAATAAPRS